MTSCVVEYRFFDTQVMVGHEIWNPSKFEVRHSSFTKVSKVPWMLIFFLRLYASAGRIRLDRESCEPFGLPPRTITRFSLYRSIFIRWHSAFRTGARFHAPKPESMEDVLPASTYESRCLCEVMEVFLKATVTLLRMYCSALQMPTGTMRTNFKRKEPASMTRD